MKKVKYVNDGLIFVDIRFYLYPVVCTKQEKHSRINKRVNNNKFSESGYKMICFMSTPGIKKFNFW